MLARGLTLLTRMSLDEADEPGEGIFDVAAQDVHIRGGCLSLHTVRLIGSALPHLAEVRALRALHELCLRRAELGILIGRVLLQRLLIRSDSTVEVTSLERIDRLLVQGWKRCLLLALLVPTAARLSLSTVPLTPFWVAICRIWSTTWGSCSTGALESNSPRAAPR